jgi:hypothetical protein
MNIRMLALALIFPLLMANEGCDSPDQADQQLVNLQQGQYAMAQPIPVFDYSLERQVAIQLYEARNREVATYTVWRSDTGVLEGDCASIGYPLPYDTSLTNPLKRVGGGNGVGVIEQAEPNGLYPSKNSIATWVRCVVDGHQVPIYVESKVTAYPFPVEVDYATGRVAPLLDAKPSVTLDKKP